MAIEKLERDLAYISKLSDYPGSQDGLSTDEFKAMFDAAPLAIQDYINNVLVPAIVAIAPGEDDGGTYLPLAGGKMKGVLDMGGQRLKNLPAPVEDGDAAPKSYVLPKTGGDMTGPLSVQEPLEAGHAASKGYVDGKHFERFVTIPASGWYNFVGSVYQNNVSVEGILATDIIDVDVYFLDHSAEAQETNLMLEEEFAKIFHIPYGNGVMWVRARELPTVDIPIKIKVVR